MKYGAPKLEMLAVVTYVKKFHSYLAPRRFRAQSGQSSPVLVKNVLHGFGNGWKMAHVLGSIQHGD